MRFFSMAALGCCEWSSSSFSPSFLKTFPGVISADRPVEQGTHLETVRARCWFKRQRLLCLTGARGPPVDVITVEHRGEPQGRPSLVG
jgi:hypothetical protein